MASKNRWVILVGGSCSLGNEAARAALESGTRVVSVDLIPSDTAAEAPLGFFEVIGDLLDPSVLRKAFDFCEGAESISVVYIASGRKQINTPLGFHEASRLQVEALQTWAREYLDSTVVNKASGAFILISSVNSVLQSHSDPFYGALKAAAESLMRSFATIANFRGYGSFLTFRLGYVQYPTITELDDQLPARRAARMLLGERPLASWGDISVTLMSLANLDRPILNGSMFWGDYGAHLREQTQATAEAIELGNR